MEPGAEGRHARGDQFGSAIRRDRAVRREESRSMGECARQVTGQVGSVYKQYPPLVNAALQPGE